MKRRIPTYNDFLLEAKTEEERKSTIDSNFNVYVVYPASEHYEAITNLIPDNGLAVTDLKTKMIILDGGKIEKQRLNKDHIRFIEAHELAHNYLNHEGSFGIAEQEKEADYTAYLLLKKRNLDKAAEMVIDYFDGRHGEDFEDFESRSGEHIKMKLKKYL